MACDYAIRPNFDHMVQLRVHVEYLYVPSPHQMTSTGASIKVRTKRRGVQARYLVVRQDDPVNYKAFLEREADSPLIQWLASDAAQGQWTYKYFLNRILVSFSDKDTAFAFKMRWL